MIEIEPQLSEYNPQRGDAKTPFQKLADWQQCMGNSMQNMWWWLAKLYPELIGFPLTEAGTFAYYHGLEAWLKQERLDWAIYNSEYHVKWLQKAIDSLGLPVRIRSADASFDAVAKVIQGRRCIVALGTRFTGVGGHIVNVIGASDTALLLSDPYGNPNLAYKSTDGFRVPVSRGFCKGRLSRFIWPEVTR